MQGTKDGAPTKGPREWVRMVLCPVLGGLGGFVLLHPYVMFLDSAGALPLHSAPTPSGGWSAQAFLALEYSMLPMAAPFALFGAAFGLLFGVYLHRAQMLHLLRMDQEKDAAALETVKALTATLSHYLLNANMIIGGQARHCRRLAPGPAILESLLVIEEQGRIIDAAVGALRELARVVILRESTGRTPMIELAREMEERLSGLAGASSAPEPGRPVSSAASDSPTPEPDVPRA